MHTVLLRKNETGEVRTYLWDGDGWDHETLDYAWSDGNYGCDCNRSTFFGEPDDTAECSEGKYTVLSITDPSGSVVYKDNR